MVPLDIDGNELKVGDLVEVVVQPVERSDGGKPNFKIGDRFEIMALLFVAKYQEMGALSSAFYGITVRRLRLIPRDTKAPTKIEFLAAKEGVR